MLLLTLSALPLRNHNVHRGARPPPSHPNGTELGCSFTLVPQPANFITKAISGFSIPMNVVIFQLIKIFLSQGVAYHRVSQTSETPLSKKSFLPLPPLLYSTVQYSISAQICVGLLHACMHTCITHIPYPRTATAHPPIPERTQSRQRCTVTAMLLTLPYIAYISAFAINSLFVNLMHNLSPNALKSTSFPIPHLFNIRLH
jgi:hypothetical protein